MNKTKLVYDYYTVEVPSDVTDDIEERNNLIFMQAEDQAKLYVIPCTWEILADDGNTAKVRRTRRVVDNRPSPTILTTWELWTYDVWGNKDDGYEVNDRFCISREYTIRLRVTEYNPNTPQAFLAAFPSDYQIKQAFGVSCNLDVSGDDVNIYVNRDSDSYPIGEMYCTSHSSLSPIETK